MIITAMNSNVHMDPALTEWLTNEKNKGFGARQLIESMVKAGYTQHHAEALVTQAYSTAEPQTASAPVAAQATDKVKQDQAAAPNAIDRNGHTAKLLFSMAQPRVTLLGDFLGIDECETLITHSRSKIIQSTVVDPETGNFVPDGRRTSQGTFFNIGETPLIQAIESRVEALLGFSVAHQEPLQILHYDIGGEYEPHFDFFDPAVPGNAMQLSRGGQRIATLIMYLNDVTSGGATIFPSLGLVVNPQRGNAIYFENTDEAGKILASTLHGGTPVGAGEKWIATKWIREGAYVLGQLHEN